MNLCIRGLLPVESVYGSVPGMCLPSMNSGVAVLPDITPPKNLLHSGGGFTHAEALCVAFLYSSFLPRLLWPPLSLLRGNRSWFSLLGSILTRRGCMSSVQVLC